jgi:2-polyprenyl-3-methyl-5-hydroxy-6-metoxy-1,4-benzoquinol methylase
MTDTARGLRPRSRHPLAGLKENLWGYQKRLHFVVRGIRAACDRPPSAVSVLDVGCGTGAQLAMPLATLGFEVTGVDTHEGSITTARASRSIGTFIHGRVSELPPRKYDVVIVSEVLEHLDHPEALLTDALPYLADKGLMFVTVPNGYGEFEFDRRLYKALRLDVLFEGLYRALRAVLRRQPRPHQASSEDESDHIQRFTLERLHRMFSNCGLEVVSQRATSLVSGPLVAHTVARLPGFVELNVRLADWLPMWASSGWMFTLQRRQSDHPPATTVSTTPLTASKLWTQQLGHDMSPEVPTPVHRHARDGATRQWNATACGELAGDKYQLEYFERVAAERYRQQPWQHDYFRFDRFGGKDVLEIGIGQGSDLLQFAKAGARCHGVDITDNHLQLTERNFALRGLAVQLHKSDATSIPLPSGSMDCVYSFGVIHHIPEAQRVVAEASRVLRPGGTLMFALYYKWSAFHLSAKLLRDGLLKGRLFTLGYDGLLATIESGADGRSIKPYVKLYSKASARRLVEAAKLRVSDLSVHQLHVDHLVPAALLRRRVHVGGLLERQLGWYVTCIASKPA